MMKDRIDILNWRQRLLDSHVDSIGQDFILMEQIHTLAIDYPFRIDVTSAIIVLKGSIKRKIDLIPYTIKAPCMVIMLAEQILEHEYISDDFDARLIIMSKRFTESLNIEERFPAFLSVRENPVIPLTDRELGAMMKYYDMMLEITRTTDNPNRLEIARNLTRAFFYGAGHYFHKIPADKEKSKQEILVDNFRKLLQDHYKEHRDIGFYSDKLCLTSKYMSTVIKETSGISAGEWIDNRVILEAKALLKSTNMTIQQISDGLNFSTQSMFGRYFKRIVGVSPKEYRRK